MHPNAELLARFYAAFASRDAEAMAACYHRDIEFCDPVFPELRGPAAADMWRMLLARASDLEVRFAVLHADEARGAARWEADYTFAPTGRKVRNRIEASFAFDGGLIRRHRDGFDLWRWSRMALGAPGWLLGWSPWLARKVRGQAARSLAAYRRTTGAP